MRRRTRVLIGLTSLAVVLVAADTAAWWVATNRMERAFAAWQQARTAEGNVIRSASPERTGWPLEAVLLLPGVTLASDEPGQPDALAWQAGAISLALAPWHYSTLDVRVAGAQTLRFGPTAPVTVQAEPLDIHIPLGPAGEAQGGRHRGAARHGAGRDRHAADRAALHTRAAAGRLRLAHQRDGARPQPAAR